MESAPKIAIIGGSGLYDIPALHNVETIDVDTPFGKPSSPVIIGSFSKKRVAFLARHGIGHFIQPSEVNYRANIYALKKLGVERIISVSACGSLREDYAPGEIVIPDQIFDFTHQRQRSFFGDGIVAHVGVADPFCNELSNFVYSAVKKQGVPVHKGGTLITIEGPRFSTRAESQVYRGWGMSVIGMTASPEVFLAREAEMCYATMAHVTDYDVWHTSEQPVTVDVVIRILKQNTETAQQALQVLVENLPEDRVCSCSTALENAIITNPNVISPEIRKKLDLMLKKYIP